ncbi:hypothetical protein BD311DRAFT_753658 [Dichomitus squalens]|uniref:Carboxylesterase type B domain-containing protein n=1 Tax=Dichomitus squalens TaxID=114155 RepID=A0A4Q9MTN6_9APHY|nr:hypothetical protein BD311DRAFT_753658 [Dichomitus squalens]
MAPPASTYEEPGFPYATLVKLTGLCPSGPASFACLQNLPFETLKTVPVAIMTNEVLNDQLWQPTVGR